MTSSATRYLLGLTLAFAGTASQGATYANSADDSVLYFGSPNTTSYGQMFSLNSSQTLLDWTFYAKSGNAGDLNFVVAAWDGFKASGPALLSMAAHYSGGQQSLAFTQLNVNLQAGNYIAYVTTAGQNSPVTQVEMFSSLNNAGLGGGFRYLDSNGVDPLTLDTTWSSRTDSLQFSANMVATAVPEPQALLLLCAGLPWMAYIRRRSI